MLKQEEGIKSQVMCEKLKNIEKQIETLSSTISDIEKALGAKALPFLQVHSHNNMEMSISLNDNTKSSPCGNPKLQI